MSAAIPCHVGLSVDFAHFQTIQRRQWTDRILVHFPLSISACVHVHVK